MFVFKCKSKTFNKCPSKVHIQICYVPPPSTKQHTAYLNWQLEHCDKREYNYQHTFASLR